MIWNQLLSSIFQERALLINYANFVRLQILPRTKPTVPYTDFQRPIKVDVYNGQISRAAATVRDSAGFTSLLTTQLQGIKMGDGVKILFCMALFVLLTQGANLSNRDEFRSESKIQSASENVVVGAVVSRKKRDFGLSTLLATLLIAGASVASATTAVATSDRLITVKIQTENYSKWRLGSPITHLESGSIRIPAALNVFPGKLEAMVARKTGFTATGSWGTVSWLVDNNSGKRIIVMWSVPYDYNLYDNWLAVGIIDDVDVGSGWTRHMYYAPHGYGHSFIRRKYSTSVHTITKCHATMCVAGSMGTGHNSEVRISFYPNNNDENNLAENVRAAITG